MPQCDLNHPPPAKPAIDKSVQDLQIIIQAMNMDKAAREQGKPSPISESRRAAWAAVQSPIVAKLAAQDLEKRWAKYDSHSLDEFARKTYHPGDMLYFRGDVIQILEKTTANWALGLCRGRLGVFPLEQTVSGPFVMTLSNYTAMNDTEISFSKGEVMPATPNQHQTRYTVFKNAHYGECSPALFTTIDFQLSVEQRRQEPQKYYQYSKLQPGQIRLITITTTDMENFTACEKQSLFVTIHHTSLENVREAVALSYCWGDPTDQKPVFANGKLLYIPSTLWRAIRRRFPGSGIESYSLAEQSGHPGGPKSPAVFWADAICINQEDALEKNHQIPLMRSIYGNAREVQVYVGEGADSLFALLVMKVITDTAEGFPPWTIVPDNVIREKMSRMDWGKVRAFLSEQVFRRTWVIQEIVLATNLTIWYGITSIKLDQILDCIKAIRMNHVRHVDSLLGFPAWTRDQSQEFRNAITQLYNLANIRSRHQERIAVSFLEILENFRHSKATDPRDKVYSLLGLASENYYNGITPDYSASNSVTSVFLDLARYAVTLGDIELLLRNAGGSQTVSVLPSWVPDWTHDSRNVIPSDQYNCCGVKKTCQAWLSPTSSPIQLIIKGSLFDKVTRKAPMLDWGGHGDLRDTFGTLSVAVMVIYHLLSMGSESVGAFDGSYPNGEDLFTAVWQTLVCGLGWDSKRTQQEDKKHIDAFFRCYQDQLLEVLATNKVPLSTGVKFVRTDDELVIHNGDLQHDTKSKILMNEPIPALSPELEKQAQLEDEMYPFLATMLHHQAERRTCITEKGYFGTIPSEAAEGDVIATFFGLRIPFVLRPLAAGTCQLIGPCYVHGIMDGEGLRSDDEGVDFVLV